MLLLGQRGCRRSRRRQHDLLDVDAAAAAAAVAVAVVVELRSIMSLRYGAKTIPMRVR